MPKAECHFYYYAFGSPMAGRTHAQDLYRFGFNGQERDDDFEGNYSYEYRIHDPRLGRFLSVDPLSAKYPWNSPFAFCENRPIAAIELEGLEANDLNDNSIIKEFETDKSTLQQNKDYSPWKDLIEFKPDPKLLDATFKRFDNHFHKFKLQNIKEAASDLLNLDYYSIEIFDDGKFTNKMALDYFRNAFQDIVSQAPKVNLYAYDTKEGEIWNSTNPEGAVMSFHMYLWGWFNAEDGSVVATKMTDSYWIFSTVETTQDQTHPVSGNRQFGVTRNSSGNLVLYIRGVDRPTTNLDKIVSPAIFDGADLLWTNFMETVSKKLTAQKISNKILPKISKRISWKDNVKN